MENEMVVKEKGSSFSKKACEASLAIFLLVCSTCLVVLLITALPLIDSGKDLIDEARNAVEETKNAQIKMVNSIDSLSASIGPMVNSGGLFMDELVKSMEESRKAQQDLVNRAGDFKEIVWELGITAAAVTMAEDGILPPTEAEQMVAESLEKIETRSERLGKIARYINLNRLEKQGGHLTINRKIYNSAAKSCLKNLAVAQEGHHAKSGAYTSDMTVLKPNFPENPDIVINILKADKHSWKASARHKESEQEMIYDSARGGLQR